MGRLNVLTRLFPLALAGCLFAVTAIAQTAPPTRIRGTIADLSGQTLSVTTRDGSKVDIMLNDPLTVSTVKALTLDDIKVGTYVGIASKTGADGKAEALEVLVFPKRCAGPARALRLGPAARQHDDQRQRQRGGGREERARPDADLQGWHPADHRAAEYAHRYFGTGCSV